MSETPLTALGLTDEYCENINMKTVQMLVWARYYGPTDTAALQVSMLLRKRGLELTLDQVLGLGEYFSKMYRLADHRGHRNLCFFCNAPLDGYSMCSCYLAVVPGKHFPVTVDALEQLKRDFPRTWGSRYVETNICEACFDTSPIQAHLVFAQYLKSQNSRGAKRGFHWRPPKLCRACHQAKLEAQEQEHRKDRAALSSLPPAPPTTVGDSVPPKTLDELQQQVAATSATSIES